MNSSGERSMSSPSKNSMTVVANIRDQGLSVSSISSSDLLPDEAAGRVRAESEPNTVAIILKTAAGPLIFTQIK
jgi:hypothetical protein